jgi:hypothetical protein
MGSVIDWKMHCDYREDACLGFPPMEADGGRLMADGGGERKRGRAVRATLACLVDHHEEYSLPKLTEPSRTTTNASKQKNLSP